MKKLLKINRVLSECKSAFNEGMRELTLNEALVLEVIKNKTGKMSEIAEILFRDRAYVSRLIKGLIEKGKVRKEGNLCILTDYGEELYEESVEVIREIIEDNHMHD